MVEEWIFLNPQGAYPISVSLAKVESSHRTDRLDLSQPKWHRESVTVANGCTQGVPGRFESPASDCGKGGVVEEYVTAGFRNLGGNNFS
tara:strand:+ start:1820 stop:2086 length:267 start_codon:yes stop_codon:yes gene_type:complete